MKIRRHLALMATAIMVPVTLVSALALNSLLGAERQALLQSMRETARATGMAVDREWSTADGVARALTISRPLMGGDFAQFDRQVRLANGDSGMHTALIDDGGRQILNTVRPFGTPIGLPGAAVRARVNGVLAAGKSQISNLIVGRATGKHVAALEIPVTLDDGRRMVISEWFYAEHFATAFPVEKQPASWLIGIFDGAGRTVLRNRGPHEYMGQLPKADLLNAITSGHPGLLRNESRDGIALYTVLSRSDRSGWTVAVGVPVHVVEAAARNAVLMSGAGFLAALLCAIAAAYLFGQRLVRALDNAVRATAALGKGEAPVLERSPIDEIGRLELALVDAGRALTASAAEREFLLADARQARAVAESQNRAKDDFLAMLGHELRNPLSAIMSGVSLLELPVGADTSARARGAIRRQCDLLVNIVDELLDASRVMTGKVSLSRQVLDLGAAVRACMDAAAMRGAGGAHVCRSRLEAVLIDADPTRLDQIINNLLDNAFKYTAEGGEVDVSVREERGFAVLEVRDSGMGIDSELLPTIFDVFIQGAASIDRAKGGLGIGLAVVKSMAAQHGASVSAASAGPGQGSTFTVRFPRASAVAAPQARAVAAPARGSATVLVIDDNDDARELLVQVLEISGHRVLQARSGEQGLALAAADLPAVAVIDIGLPGLSGYEVAAALRAGAATGAMRLVALTGYGQEDDRAEALASGFDLHMTKPAKLDELLAEIARAGPEQRPADI
ncbi:MAG: hybrid sensor histidine kinase/response regulator [Bdellovibrionales bacterium]|nr:hybrid sensor histidine kinase/response regulator [Massilia sp.]